jgi:hypothetical protein
LREDGTFTHAAAVFDGPPVRDRCGFSNASRYSDIQAIGYAVADRHPNCYVDRHCDGYTDRYADRHADPHADADGYTYADIDRYADTHGYTEPNGNSNGHVDPHTNGHANADGRACGHLRRRAASTLERAGASAWSTVRCGRSPRLSPRPAGCK